MEWRVDVLGIFEHPLEFHKVAELHSVCFSILQDFFVSLLQRRDLSVLQQADGFPIHEALGGHRLRESLFS